MMMMMMISSSPRYLHIVFSAQCERVGCKFSNAKSHRENERFYISGTQRSLIHGCSFSEFKCWPFFIKILFLQIFVTNNNTPQKKS